MDCEQLERDDQTNCSDSICTDRRSIRACPCSVSTNAVWTERADVAALISKGQTSWKMMVRLLTISGAGADRSELGSSAHQLTGACFEAGEKRIVSVKPN